VTRNVLGALPTSVHAGARRALNEIILAEDRSQAERAVEAFAGDYGVKWPKAVAKVTGEAERLLCFFDYPAEHWLHLRTTDESFKALAALPAGPGAIRLRVGRGRPRSQEQDRGAGSPAAQLCPVEGPNVAPQWRRPRPCSPVRMVAAWAPSCR
jgi:putative transposase